MSLKMSRDEREAYLAELHVGVLAIPDAVRGPLAAPVWYVYEPGGELWFSTGTDSRKGRLLEVGTRISLVAQREEPPYSYVSIEGPVTAREPANKEQLSEVAVRYLGQERGRKYADDWKPGSSVIVRVQPERWLTTDYGKA